MGKFLSQGVDYLGFLEAKLRDMPGFDRVVYELIQNADDAPGATRISFNFTDEALVVENDGSFRDKDFERIRLVASRGKRDEQNTIGSFGIGFISVYHITDHPEIISSGLHWVLRPENPEDKRIEEIRVESGPGTRFILPWARDPGSLVRDALRLEAVGPEQIQAFLQELCEVTGQALLFLRKIETLEVLRDGETITTVTRLKGADHVVVRDGDRETAWHAFRGGFDVEGRRLREQYPQIEGKRRAEVVVLVPDTPLKDGLLFAYLPTQHSTGLPFHINADFFTSSDRRRVIFDSDYQSEWNRSAVRAAAEVLGKNVEKLPAVLGHTGLWQFLDQVRQICADAEKQRRERCLSAFWEEVRPHIPKHRLIYTRRGEWVKPSEAVLPGDVEPEGVRILSELGLPLVHDDLRKYYNLLTSKDVGVRSVTLSRVADALKCKGLTRSFSVSEAPFAPLRSDDGYRALWALLDSLSRRGPADGKQALRSCAIARCRDGKLRPLDGIYRTDDDDTAELFSAPPFNVSFLDTDAADSSLLKELVQSFTLRAAVSTVRSVNTQLLEQAWKEKRWDPRRLCRWFESRKRELEHDRGLKETLTALPVFPAGGCLHPLEDLVLPGDFRDPLGLTEVVDLDALRGCRDFLRELGAGELTFLAYARDHIPRAFRTRSLPRESRRRLIALLAERLGQIRDSSEIRRELAQWPLVECADGEFRKPTDVYFDNEETKLVLGDTVSYARLTEEGREAATELLKWLGVAVEPRLEKVVERIARLAEVPPSVDGVQKIQALFEYLGSVWTRKAPDRRDRSHLEAVLSRLKSLAWLPAERDASRWYRPGELYAAFRRHLFETQARFLDVPRGVQSSRADFLKFLQVRTEPQTVLVVQHLLHCAAQNRQVTKDIYQFLNQRADEPPIGRLRDTACLLLPDGRYVRPDQVFWEEHLFGRYRYRLGPELREYQRLFDRLGVKERPGPSEAVAVILEIAEEYGRQNRPLDEDAHRALLKGWEILSRAVEDGEDIQAEIEKLKGRKTVPDGRRVLNPPEWMFFEDRPGLARKFRGLEYNVIPRPEGAWLAMSCAGVRQLSWAVQARLLECSDPTPDGDLRERLKDRRNLLVRVIDPLRVRSPSEWDVSVLERLTCYCAERLVVRYVVGEVFNRKFLTEPEEVSVFCHQDRLYYSRSDGDRPWLDIARELAFAMNPSSEAANAVLTLKEVLAASSTDGARALLDQVGLPSLDEVPPDEPDQTEPVCNLGGESVPEDPKDLPRYKPSPGRSEEDGEERKPRQGVRGMAGPGEHEGSSGRSGGFVERTGPDDGKTRKDPARDEELDPGKTVPAPPSDESERSTPEPKKRLSDGGRLRSYVTSKVPPEIDKRFVGRSNIEQAGLERVKECERRQGRNPKEMPPNHPGYDVESFDSALENGVRYIEVKALSGEWTSFGVGLTDTQFKAAEEKGERYWLYVVERANQEDYRIILIQDPARKVNQFLYDDGWKEVADGVYPLDEG